MQVLKIQFFLIARGAVCEVLGEGGEDTKFHVLMQTGPTATIFFFLMIYISMRKI